MSHGDLMVSINNQSGVLSAYLIQLDDGADSCDEKSNKKADEDDDEGESGRDNKQPTTGDLEEVYLDGAILERDEVVSALREESTHVERIFSLQDGRDRNKEAFAVGTRKSCLWSLEDLW